MSDWVALWLEKVLIQCKSTPNLKVAVYQIIKDRKFDEEAPTSFSVEGEASI